MILVDMAVAVLLFLLIIIAYRICKKFHRVAQNTSNVRWKSEYELYSKLKKRYKDCEYQKKFKWLGQQSLDIYIPSKKIAVEYQGIQHFKPVGYFGGRSAYKKQRALDKRKWKLCKRYDITLLYFTKESKAPDRVFFFKKVYKDYNQLLKRIKYNWLRVV